MINRSRSDLVSLILEAAKEGTTRTRIMYSAYLSSGQTKYYLKMLVESGLVAQVATTKSYKTTKKGLEVLALYDRLNQLSNVEKLQINVIRLLEIK